MFYKSTQKLPQTPIPEPGLYLGKFSLGLRTRQRQTQTIERDLPYCKLKVIFRSKCQLFRS